MKPAVVVVLVRVLAQGRPATALVLQAQGLLQELVLPVELPPALAVQLQEPALQALVALELQVPLQ